MNAEEAKAILTMVGTYQPGQKVNQEFAVSMWVDAFSSHDFRDVRDSVRKLGTAPRRDGDPFYFELRDVLQDVNATVTGRAASRPVEPPPNDLTPLEYRRWLAADARRREARDWTPAVAIDAPVRPVQSLIRRIAMIRDGAHPESREAS